MTRQQRRQSIDKIQALNQLHLKQVGDPEILTRISQYEMAYKMQSSVPELMDIAAEPDTIHAMYGTTQFWSVDGQPATVWIRNWAANLIENAPHPKHG